MLAGVRQHPFVAAGLVRSRTVAWASSTRRARSEARSSRFLQLERRVDRALRLPDVRAAPHIEALDLGLLEL
jgi:hypothetical protein